MSYPTAGKRTSMRLLGATEVAFGSMVGLDATMSPVFADGQGGYYQDQSTVLAEGITTAPVIGTGAAGEPIVASGPPMFNLDGSPWGTASQVQPVPAVQVSVATPTPLNQTGVSIIPTSVADTVAPGLVYQPPVYAPPVVPLPPPPPAPASPVGGGVSMITGGGASPPGQAPSIVVAPIGPSAGLPTGFSMGAVAAEVDNTSSLLLIAGVAGLVWWLSQKSSPRRRSTRNRKRSR